ncbi:homoserine O-acetyltransferase MetX [Pseudonocardia sp. HH130630-07]|uniref:homoserine O-acetyltransferase MetX n=1 Tax=Pseudonocardia sp. HH130630-07 TaxID=1690815 RepID=UPI000814DAB0|nr:homoserine O-acetyltransferase [Pseudonocardia sp. HH130630-07]ANY10257.1 homoserine O-acetyltransferase [Pseudonocardia sp. HH130630-07]
MNETGVVPPPASGGWREGDDPGRRRFLDLPAPLKLEAGGELPGVRLSYETWGELAPDGSNAVLVLHALTGDTHLQGPAGPGHPTAGWWPGLIEPGGPLDPARWFVVAPNAVGGCQGSTGPASPAPDGRTWGSRFPLVTVRDMVAAEQHLADALGIDAFACVIGGSMGSMRSLEWAATEPDRVRRLLLLAGPAASSADQIGWARPQIEAIRTDPFWHGGDYHERPEGPWRGLGVARRIAHLSYRSGYELATRFGRSPQDGADPLDGGRYAVESYLDHHADKLVHRFDAASYVRLTQAMNHHDVGRGRGGTAAGLARVRALTRVAGVTSDRLYPLAEQEQLADGIAGSGPLHVIESPYGHDGFLIETAVVARLLGELLAEPV